VQDENIFAILETIIFDLVENTTRKTTKNAARDDDRAILSVF